MQKGGNGNKIDLVFQDKHKGDSGNVADITMSGSSNTIKAAVQAVTGRVAGNEMNVTITGADNGNWGLSGYAAQSGATTSELKQGFEDVDNGTVAKGNNQLDLMISGARNQFGVTQEFTNNKVGMLTITGDYNQMGVFQSGDSNEVALATVSGEDNNIGLAQVGDRNFVSATVNKSDNDVLSTQTGNDNETYIDVNGYYNDASISVTGDSNYINAAQRGVGGMHNEMTVTVTGNGNNMVGFSDAFTGDALLARNVADSATGLTFRRGSVWQHGNSNSLSVTVGGSGSDSDYNSFAMLQKGNGNSIDGSISGGNSNQVAVAQLGGGNAATFNQVGSFNNLGITQ